MVCRQNITAQDTIVKTSNETSSMKISFSRQKYVYQNKQVPLPKLYSLLKDTKDEQIIHLVKKSKRMNYMQYIGFVGVPFAIGTFISLIQATTLPKAGADPDQTKYYRNKWLIYAGSCAVIGLAFPVTSIVCRNKRRNYNREAIKLYNEKY